MAIATGQGPGPKVMSASTLIGDKVVNLQGEDLGKIEELMIDTDTGNVNYAVLSFGGFLGLGDKLFAIPFESLQLDPEHKRFVLDESKEHLKNAPGFDKHDWPVMSQEWGEEIHRYYNVSPRKGGEPGEYRH
ncbi:MAG: PRC-barrel domain-containing protein [Syntrophotaleaceae bacterium]